MPHSTSHHHSSYHVFHITPAHGLFHFAIDIGHSYASCHISHCIPFYITFHIMPHSMYSTPHFRPHHILATLCIAPPHLTQHSTASCITAFHLTVTTPKSTSHYHVSHNVPHHTSVHHILNPTTYHISHNTTSTIAYPPHSTSVVPHRTTFHIHSLSLAHPLCVSNAVSVCG